MLYSVYAVLGVCSNRCMQYSVYAVISVCSTRRKLYSVYAVLGVFSGFWQGNIERDNRTWCSLEMVVLRTTKRELRWYRGKHHVKLRLQKMPSARNFAIPNTAGTSPDLLCNFNDTRSSEPQQATSESDVLHPLVTSTLYSSSSPISLFLVHNSTLIAEHKVKLSLLISLCHNHGLTPCRESTTYTEYFTHP